VDNLRETIEGLADAIVERVQPLGLSVLPKDRRAPHYLGLRTERQLPPQLLPELARRQVFVSVRGSSIRVTPHVYNTEADVDRFVEALEAVL
jgi:selenocysteine lyase/cysteine desulfurase